MDTLLPALFEIKTISYPCKRLCYTFSYILGIITLVLLILIRGGIGNDKPLATVLGFSVHLQHLIFYVISILIAFIFILYLIASHSIDAGFVRFNTSTNFLEISDDDFYSNIFIPDITQIELVENIIPAYSDESTVKNRLFIHLKSKTQIFGIKYKWHQYKSLKAIINYSNNIIRESKAES